MKRLIGLFVFSFACLLFGQIEMDDKSEFGSVAPFYVDVLCMGKSDSIRTKIEVFVQVPFNRVHFYKEGDAFKGEYSITMGIYDTNQVLLTERSWFEKVAAKTFEETMAKANFNLSHKTISLKPNIYHLKFLFEDKDSHKSYYVKFNYDVRSYPAGIGLSDLLLLNAPFQAGSKIMPNVSKIIQTKNTGIPVVYEIYSDSATKFTVSYTILSLTNALLYRKDVEKEVPPGKTQVTYSFDSVQYNAGEYKLSVALLNSELNSFNSVQKRVTYRQTGLPLIIRDLDKAIDQMMYIARKSEMDSIRNAGNYDAKLERFLEFWKKKDPNQATEENEIFSEYYRRIEYANKTFTHYAEGWRSDMGMVYVILGVPNNVERHPFDYDSKPYEVWEYYDLNKRFVFVDQTGFGDYRLVTPLYGDTYRFR